MLLLEDVAADVAGRRLLDGANLVVPRGACVFVATHEVAAGRLLLRLLAGTHTASAGRVRVDGLDPAVSPALEGRVRTVTSAGEAPSLRRLALDRSADVWLVDATSARATELAPLLALLQRPTAAGHPTVLALVDPAAVPPSAAAIRLRGGRLIGSARPGTDTPGP